MAVFVLKDICKSQSHDEGSMECQAICGAHSSLSKDKHSWWSSEPLDGQGTMTRSFVMLESAGRVIDEGQSRAVLQDWSVNLDIQYWLASRESFSRESGLHQAQSYVDSINGKLHTP